jgi:hypothetical protein
MNYGGNPISNFKPDFRFLETFETFELNKTSTLLESSKKYDPKTDVDVSLDILILDETDDSS